MSAAPSGPIIAPPRQRLGDWAMIAAVAGLVVASFVTLDIQWAALFAPDSLSKMGEFVAGFVPPDLSAPFLRKVAAAAFETFAMSLVGTALAAVLGLALALPASHRTTGGGITAVREAARLVLNVLRSIPELVWAAMLVIAAGLGPFPGTLALTFHTAGVLGRLFADALENTAPHPANALRENGSSAAAAFLYAKLPQAAPQFLSYALYRWENNIRAATVLGVVGAGGLGQLLYFHMSLFHFQQVATVLGAMLVLVALVDGLSFAARRRLTR